MKSADVPPTVISDDIPSPDPVSLNFFRPIPPNGRRCAYSGLTHAAMYRQLVFGPARHQVRVANLRQPGQVRAQTLYHVGDWIAYLSRLAEQQRVRIAQKVATGAPFETAAEVAA